MIGADRHKELDSPTPTPACLRQELAAGGSFTENDSYPSGDSAAAEN